MKPLLYLEYKQIINSIRNTTRSPRRLIPVLIFSACIISWIFQNIFLFSGAYGNFGPRRNAAYQMLSGIPVDWIKLGVFLFFSVGSIAILYNAFSNGLLIFSIPQIDFMFPTPISRRKVLLIKLIKDYIKYGIYVAFFFIFAGSPLFGALNVRVFPAGFVSIAAVIGLLLTVINLANTINIVFTFAYERLKQAGIIVKLLLVAPLALAVIIGVLVYYTSGGSDAGFLSIAKLPIISIIFAPANWASTLFLAPFLGVSSDGWLELAMLWVLAGVSFLLLMSRKENIYEPSIAISIRRAKYKSALKSGDYLSLRADKLRAKGDVHSGSSSIPPFGRGAVALVWKNLLIRYRMSKKQLALMLILPILLIYLIKHYVGSEFDDILRYAPAILVYIILILSNMASMDIRTELKHANILKSMPIAAWKLILAQILSITTYLCAGICVFALLMWAMLPQTRNDIMFFCIIVSFSLAFVNVSAISIACLLYPDTKDMSQNYLTGIIGFVLIAIALLPTIILTAALHFLFDSPLSVMAYTIFAVNCIIGCANTAISGVIFSKFDPTSE